MAACDICVNLRSPTMGETSGSVIRQLSLGKPVVVSDVGWFAELPDDVALKVPVDARETDDALRRARAARARRARRAARCPLRRSSSSAASTTSTGLPSSTSLRSSRRSEATAVADAVLGDVARAAADVGIEAGSAEATELARRLAEVELGR